MQSSQTPRLSLDLPKNIFEPLAFPIHETSKSTQTESLPALPPPPNREVTQAEVAENPHATPHSIIEFAASLAPRMQQALRSIEEAELFFEELKTCALRSSDESVESIQAICLSNAQLLAKSHPHLQNTFRSLLSQANPQVTRLVEL